MSTGQLSGVAVSRKIGVCRVVLARSGLFSESEGAPMSQSSSRWYLISWKELLCGVVLVGLTAGGFFLHPLIANIGIGVMMFLIAGIAIRAVVLPGPSRAFALGFLVPYAMYLVATLMAASPMAHRVGYFREYERSGGILTTTQVMQSWLASGIFETQTVTTLMTCGHLLIAFVLGYIGGKYGQAIYNQSQDE